MATVPFPTDDPGLWNIGQLGSYVLPGRFELDGLPLGRVTDTKKPGAKSKGTRSDKGYELAKFKGRLHIWTREQHAEWERLMPLISPRREGATKDPFELKHAQAIEAGITAVTIKKITPGPWTKGLKRVIEFDFEEWSPESTKVKKGTGAVKNAQQKTPLGNDVSAAGGINPLLHPASLLTDPADPAEIMKKLLGQ